MGEDATGESMLATSSKGRAVVESLAFDVVSGDRRSSTLTTFGTRATGEVQLRAAQSSAGRPPTQPFVPPSVRHSCQSLIRDALDHLDIASDEKATFFIRNNALARVKESLEGLWGFRQRREMPFSEVVNMLQMVFLGRQVEDFGERDLAVLKGSLDRLLEESFIDEDFAAELAGGLLEGGIDVFREIE